MQLHRWCIAYCMDIFPSQSSTHCMYPLGQESVMHSYSRLCCHWLWLELRAHLSFVWVAALFVHTLSGNNIHEWVIHIPSTASIVAIGNCIGKNVGFHMLNRLNRSNECAQIVSSYRDRWLCSQLAEVVCMAASTQIFFTPLLLISDWLWMVSAFPFLRIIWPS